MKIRILDSSIRLRLSQVEITALAAGENIICEVPFPDGKVWTYALEARDQPELFKALLVENGILICMAKSACKALNETDLIGRDDHLKTPQGELKILVEKDFKCLTPRAEDESALYENPGKVC